MDLLSLLTHESRQLSRSLPIYRTVDSLIPFLICLTLLSIPLYSCGKAQSVKSDLQIKTDSIYASLEGELPLQHGYDVYRSYGCVLCHGLNGEGGKKNRNAQTGEEIPSLTYTAEGFTAGEFREKVRGGVSKVAKLDSIGETPPFAMPGWDGMSESELTDLTLYVWNLYPKDEEDEW